MTIQTATGALIVFALLWFGAAKLGWIPFRTAWVFLTGSAASAAGYSVLPYAIEAWNLFVGLILGFLGAISQIAGSVG